MAFLLLLCVTGLPLIFHDEIDALVGEDYEAALPGPPSATAGHSLDARLATALKGRPGEVPQFMAFSQDSPLLTVTTGPRPNAPAAEMTLLFLCCATGAALGHAPTGGFMETILELHTDLLLGLPGMLFLGAMGIGFVVSLVSGVVLYAPFMRRLPFATVRTDRGQRVARLDQHNLVGMVALGWMLVVGLTGVINAFADPLTESWQNCEVAAMTRATPDCRRSIRRITVRSTPRWQPRARRCPAEARSSSAFPAGRGVARTNMLCSSRATGR